MSKHDENNNNGRGGYSVGDLFGMAIILGTALGVGVGAYLLREPPAPPAPPKKPTRRTAPPIEVEDYADDGEGGDVPRVGEGIN
jgi:hypothetical protein